MNHPQTLARLFFAPEDGGSSGGHADHTDSAHHSGSPTDSGVSALAHRFWEEEGRPEGKAEEHWDRAYRQIHGGESSTSQSSSAEEQRTPEGENL